MLQYSLHVICVFVPSLTSICLHNFPISGNIHSYIYACIYDYVYIETYVVMLIFFMIYLLSSSPLMERYVRKWQSCVGVTFPGNRFFLLVFYSMSLHMFWDEAIVVNPSNYGLTHIFSSQYHTFHLLHFHLIASSCCPC